MLQYVEHLMRKLWANGDRGGYCGGPRGRWMGGPGRGFRGPMMGGGWDNDGDI